MQTPRVLVIEDDPGVRQLVGDILRAESVEASLAADGREGLAILSREPIDVLFTDLRLPGRNGISVLEQALQLRPQLAAVVFTGYASLESSIEAMQRGACDYVPKPITPQKILSSLKRALDRRRSLENPSARPGRTSDSGNGRRHRDIVAVSAAMREVLALIAKIAPTDSPVVIQGEPGVGKELVARTIHQKSSHQNGAFVRVVCAAIPEEQLISELFGQATGAAAVPVRGLLEQASGGTLFLDDVRRLPLWAQGKLLDALHDGWFQRPRGNGTVSVNVRVIASTTTDLEVAVAEGQFHRSLYYYLNVVPIQIPPLRMRQEDIKVLANHFLEQFSRMRGLENSDPQFSKEVWECLLRYDWPGNARELANVVERGVLLATDEEIKLADVPELLREPHPQEYGDMISVPLAGSLREIERHIIQKVIQLCRGNKAAAARTLGLDRRSLYRRLNNESHSSLASTTPHS